MTVWQRKGGPYGIHCTDVALGAAQISVVHVVRVNIYSGDCSPIVDNNRAIGGTTRSLTSASASVRSVESRKLAVRPPHEAVVHTILVTIGSCDRSPLV